MVSSISMIRIRATLQGGQTLDMELLFNDASLHGQLDIQSFRQAIGRIMAIRYAGRCHGRELQCNRNAANALITPDQSMPKFIQFLAKDQRSAVQLWLTRTGPFWDDSRRHSEGDWLECLGHLVTGTAVAEAAHAVLHGRACGLVSIDPSTWLRSPLSVDWRGNGIDQAVSVENYWTVDAVERALEAAPAPVQSWAELERAAARRYPGLSFAQDAFEPLSGHPFSRSAASRILERLGILDEFRDCFDENGRRTAVGSRMYQEHFTGGNAIFSDSSDAEKDDFRAQLTFRHPARVGESLFCTWHGKVRTQQLRLHFSWPIRAGEPVYIVYVGPKITRR